MGAQHTPGPWAVNPAFARVDALGANSPVPVCQLLWPTDLRSEEETEANARIIAGSPDLLAALEYLVAHYVGMVASGDCGFWNAEEDEVVIKARAAIAKATGR